MYNIWIFLSDSYCALPLGFDKRKNEGGMKHINVTPPDKEDNKDEKEAKSETTSGLIHAKMKFGDFVVFRTVDVAHSALKVYDETKECKDMKADCRMSIEIRVMGYGDKKTCRAVLPANVLDAYPHIKLEEEKAEKRKKEEEEKEKKGKK